MLKKLLAFFEAVFVVFLVILIITIFTFFVSFSKENLLPTVFGHSFFILDTDDMQNENGNGINNGALVIASDDELDSLKEGMVVLCDINDIETAEPNYDVLRIYAVEPGSETTKYTVSNEKMASNRTYIIEKDKIVAKCKYSSDLLGQIIAFSKTTQGILTLVIIPCIVLIALQIVHIIARAKRNKFEQVQLENFEFPSDMVFPDDEQSPLYDPTKSDYSQKTDVEEYFANADMKNSSKRKKKLESALEKDNINDEVKEAEKSNNEEKIECKSVESKDSKKTKTEAKKSVAAVVATDSNDKSKDLKKDKFEEKTNGETTEAEKESDKIVSETSEKTEILLEIEATDSDDSMINTNEASAIDEVKSPDSLIEENNEKSDISIPVAEIAPDDAVKNVNAEIVADSIEETAKEVESELKPITERPKKKTTVKKRAVVKKGPSTSAADLLKAIDTESKKLK